MIIHQFFIPGISHSSYLVAGDRTCAIIDPSRDIARYISAAQNMGLKITHILETHLHADFISGHIDLAEATGARITAPLAGNCAFPHLPLAEGDELELEDIRLSVIETPGHTPEHICYLATDTSRGETPVAIFSGDTLFVGDVGRPDIFPGRAEELASSLYDNLHDKIMSFPEECEVYPAHGRGSLCGRMMAAKRTSTIGYEKKYNYALRIRDRTEFIRKLTSEIPAVPDHFTRCSEINRKGPVPMNTLKQPTPIGSVSFFNRMKKDNVLVLDVRSFAAFSGLNLPGTWNIDLAGNFAIQAGWILPPEHEILLVVDEKRQAEEAALQLHRVGFDNIAAFLEGGILSWSTSGLPVGHIPIISSNEALSLIRANEAVLIDVRSKEEWETAHSDKSLNIPWHDLRTRFTELDPAMHYIVMCRGGQRASIAASILKIHGFTKISNIAGGYSAYSKADI